MADSFENVLMEGLLDETGTKNGLRDVSEHIHRMLICVKFMVPVLQTQTPVRNFQHCCQMLNSAKHCQAFSYLPDIILGIIL